MIYMGCAGGAEIFRVHKGTYPMPLSSKKTVADSKVMHDSTRDGCAVWPKVLKEGVRSEFPKGFSRLRFKPFMGFIRIRIAEPKRCSKESSNC